MGFLAMPIFFLRIPDYILCLPVWFFQVFIIKRGNSQGLELVQRYENSLLFQHEMMFGELFGLHRILTGFARNPEIGVTEAAKRITHVYWFTFQQKQAQKAVLRLGKDPELAHAFIHHLLQEKNQDLLNGLAAHSGIARCYRDLFPSTEKWEKAVVPFSIDLPKANASLFFRRNPSQVQPSIPDEPFKRLEFVLEKLARFQDYRYNDDIVLSLRLARNLWNAETPRELIAMGEEWEPKADIPQNIPYLIQANQLLGNLSPLIVRLRELDQFKRMDARRDFLRDLKEDVEKLGIALEENMYPPFSHLWREVLENVASIIEEEYRTQRESAKLAADLLNPQIPRTTDGAALEFEITGQGNENARDIRLELESDDQRIFSGQKILDLPIMFPGLTVTSKLPISADYPCTTWVRGHLYYSDRLQADKSIPFSFPVTIFEEKAEFQKIPNPYVAGKSLGPENQLFIERQDIFEFIDHRILTSGEHHTIALHGLRRTGKTTLLKRIEREGFTHPALKPVYFDMQGVDDEKDFYRQLTRAVSPERYPAAKDGIASFGDFRDFLDDSPTHADGQIPVILMDEFETLQDRVAENRISKAVFSHLRHLMQHEDRLILLFCGAHRIEELSADYWGAFFNTATYCQMNFFSRRDTDFLAQNPVKDYLNYDQLSLDRLWRLTAGHPYLVQLLCLTLVERLNTREKRNYALANDVDNAAQEIVQKGNDQFCPWVWKSADDEEKLVLSALATIVEDTLQDRVPTDAVWEKIAPLKITQRPDCIERLHRLESRGILHATDAGYGFPIGLLQRYLAMKHPFRRVRAEM
jgi:hypothetical protein